MKKILIILLLILLCCILYNDNHDSIIKYSNQYKDIGLDYIIDNLPLYNKQYSLTPSLTGAVYGGSEYGSEKGCGCGSGKGCGCGSGKGCGRRNGGGRGKEVVNKGNSKKYSLTLNNTPINKSNIIVNHSKDTPLPITNNDLTKIEAYKPDNELIDNTIIINKNNDEINKGVFKNRHPWYYNKSSKYPNINDIDSLPNLNIKFPINKKNINQKPIGNSYHFINNGEYENLYKSKVYTDDIRNGLLEYNNIQNSLLGDYIPNKFTTNKVNQVNSCFK